MPPSLDQARAALAAQPFSRLLGAQLNRFGPDGVELEVPVRPAHRQQHGFAHGGLLGYAADTAVAVGMLAWQSAARGLHEDAHTALNRAKLLTDRAGTTSFAAHQAVTAAFCALCRSDPAAAVSLLEARIAADGGVGSMGEPLGVAPDLVEAYVAVGRRDEAAALAERFAAVTPPAAPPWLRALWHGVGGSPPTTTRPPCRRTRRPSPPMPTRPTRLKPPAPISCMAPGCAAAVNASRRGDSCVPLTTPSRKWTSRPGCFVPPTNSQPPEPAGAAIQGGSSQTSRQTKGVGA